MWNRNESMEITKINTIYKGNHLTSFMGIVLMLFFIFVCFYFVKGILDGYAAAALIGFPFFFVMFSVFTLSMNYFVLTDGKIICKNPFWFWRVNETDFSSITGISIV